MLISFHFVTNVDFLIENVFKYSAIFNKNATERFIKLQFYSLLPNVSFNRIDNNNYIKISLLKITTMISKSNLIFIIQNFSDDFEVMNSLTNHQILLDDINDNYRKAVIS